MKTSLASLVLACGLCAAPLAAAQESLTLSTWGTGALISDELGLFGTPGTERIDGLDFTISLTLDTGPLHGDVRPGYAWFQYQDGVPAIASGVATINGQVWRWNLVDPYASAWFSREANAVSMSAAGLDRATGHDVSLNEVLDLEPGSQQVVVSDDYRDTVLFEGVRNERDERETYFSSAYLWITGNLACDTCPGGVREGLTWFVADEPNYARWTVSAVPEPAHASLLAAGLAVLAGLARRRLR